MAEAPVTQIIGRVNTKRSADWLVGKYGLGQRNERGDWLLQFCQENNFIIKNTFYQLPRKRDYTWKSPGDTKDYIIRNQIDYITIKNRYKNTIESVKTYPGADIGSDHNPVVAQFRIKLKRVKTPKPKQVIDINRLNDKTIKHQVERGIQANLEKLENTEKIPELDINKYWAIIKKNLLEPAKNILKREKPKKQKEWMSDEILLLVNSRRLSKGKNEEQYKQINTEMKRKISDAIKQWLQDKCKEIENLEAKYDSFYLHKKITKKYYSDLYSSINSPPDTTQQNLKKKIMNVNSEILPPITGEEIEKAIRDMKRNKVPEDDEMSN
ncbi:uncharacterized protein [Diabrotica undecimpunctata]|uniref:uncharacterized protein n=1 Tax=Diabrotica undecimpunctata TaxID=50387 RepID=UPI003B640764